MTRSLAEKNTNLPSFAANASNTIEHDSKGLQETSFLQLGDASCSSIRHFQALNAYEYVPALTSEDPGGR